MANNMDVIPPNLVNILFGEDLISFVSNLHNVSFVRISNAERYREFIYNGFNENVQSAAEYITQMLEWEIDEEFAEFHEQNQVNITSFIRYAENYKIVHFHEGLEPVRFLNYCIRLASMASYFVKYHVQETFEVCLYFIVEVFNQYNMFHGGWDVLNTVAKNYKAMKNDSSKLLSPDMSDSLTSDTSSESLDQRMSDSLTSDTSRESLDQREIEGDHANPLEMEANVSLLTNQLENVEHQNKNEELQNEIADGNSNNNDNICQESIKIGSHEEMKVSSVKESNKSKDEEGNCDNLQRNKA